MQLQKLNISTEHYCSVQAQPLCNFTST